MARNKTPITQAYEKWGRSTTAPNIPNQRLPFLSDTPAGRAFSVGDLINWILLNKEALANNGPTGVGKSRGILYHCTKHKKHLSVVVPGTQGEKSDFLTAPGQDNKGKYLALPAQLPMAVIHKGVVLIDEAANMGSAGFTSFNNLVQGNQDMFMSHMGMVDLDWSEAQYVLNGNFHHKNPDLGAAERYRFVWIDFKRQTGEASMEVSKALAYGGQGKSYTPKGKYKARDVRKKPLSDSTIDKLAELANDLFQACNEFAELNQRAENGSAGRFTLARRGATTPSPGTHADIARFLENKRNAWRQAAEVPHSVVEKMARLYHPEMTQLDYREVLTYILVNPATAVARTPFHTTVAAYERGMLAIVDDRLNRYFPMIRDTLK